MNKIKWMFIVTFMFGIVSFNCTSVRAEEIGVGTEIDTSVFEYERSSTSINWDGTIIITTYNGTNETVIIPSEIDGMKVKSVRGFSGNNAIKYVTVQEGITEIGRFAFADCKNLETVYLPNGLDSIGKHAFDSCSSLKNIILPDGLKIINSFAFKNCSSLTNINIPNSVTKIGDSAFRFCISLKTITIPDSVIYIGEDAFNIRNDKRIIVYGNPDAYIKTYCDFSENVMFSCINHSKIVIDPLITPTCIKNGKTEGSHCSDCGMSIIQQNMIKATGHNWDKGTITVEPTIKNKGEITYTCTACRKKKTEILPVSTIPKKGKTISTINSQEVYKVTKSGKKNGTVEFTKSNSIDSANISIPNIVTINGITYKVTSVAKNAFKNNKTLKSITINGNITKINANAFKGCSNLKTIKIKSKNLKTVGKNAFKGIHKKAKIKVPSKSLKKYQILLKDKGQKPSVKIIK